jgi:hypothetical protein
MKEDLQSHFHHYTIQRVVMDNYLEIHKETSNGTLYYDDKKRDTIVSVFCLWAIVQRLTSMTEKSKQRCYDVLHRPDH